MELERTFGLADDREKVLEDFVPGSVERYYHRCLHLQHQGALGEVPAVLEEWRERHGKDSRWHEIEDRQALLDFWRDEDAHAEHLRQRLSLSFSHNREDPDAERRYPSALDPELIAWSTLRDYGVRYGGLSSFTPLGLDRVAREVELDPDKRRELLDRIAVPDFDQLPEWIASELAREKPRPFAQINARSLLTLAQLERLAELRPELLNDSSYVEEMLQRLLPPEHADADDPAVRQEHLGRLSSFCDRLGTAFNALKLEVLHHTLQLARESGASDEQLLGAFLVYLALPRHASYVARGFLESTRHLAVNLGQRHGSGLEPVRDDEPLVRELLERLLRDAEDTSAFDELIEARYLRERFVTSKLLHGVGDPDEWAALLDQPALLARLRERIELRFALGSPERFARDEEVSLTVELKNVRELTIKVFRLNVASVFHATGRDVGLSIDLDGLVPELQRVEAIDAPALRRETRSFSFPELSEPGVYVIDFLGGGRNSRALVRKGSLRLVERPTAAGQVVRVIDERGRACPSATLWLGGRDYRPDEEGRILVPYTGSPGTKQVLLQDGGLTSVASFPHREERFELSCGLHVDREHLVEGVEATALVRAALTVHGAPASLELLSEVGLTITTSDQRGVETTSEARDLKLLLDDEARHTFRVPPGAASLSLDLRATLERPIRGDQQHFSASRSYEINGIDGREQIRALYLARREEGYRLEARGKSGEVLPSQSLSLDLQPRLITGSKSCTLQTDEQGGVDLGELRDVAWLRARLPGGPTQEFLLAPDRVRLPSRIHAAAGEEVSLPYMGSSRAPSRSSFALFELRRGRYLRDCFTQLRLSPGRLRLVDLEPGSYVLWLKEEPRTRVELEIGPALDSAAGEDAALVGRWLASPRRLLELRNRRPLCMAPVEVDAEALTLRLEGVTPRTRVHLLATRYQPAHDLYAELGDVPRATPLAATVPSPRSRYEAERQLPEEVRYVLERGSADPLPGNLLERPSLLLNPWAMRDTRTDTQDAKGGGGFGGRLEEDASYASDAYLAKDDAALGEGSEFPTFDFLPRGARLLAGLRPDEQGVVRVPRAELGDAQLVRVLALDPQNALERSVALPASDYEPRDRRLLLGLDPGEHFTEQRTVTPLKDDDPLEVDDLTATKLTRYDSLERVYRLFATLNPSDALETFGFLTRWPTLSQAEQEELYSEHACHELHVFLFRRDPEFFARVVKPYLAHKRHRTFLDAFLLEEDLSPFAEPAAFARLNTFERILLARRQGGSRDGITRSLADVVACRRRDPEGDARRFDTALAGQGHDEDDGLGIAARTESLREARRDEAKKQAKERSASKRKRSRRAPAAPSKAMAPPPAPAPMAQAMLGASMSMLAAEECEVMADCDDEWGEVELERGLREEVVELYRPLDTTKEWGESNYYRLRPDQCGPGLVPNNRFWRDFAAHDEASAFLSPHVAEASSCFTEQALALAVLDLPFTASEPEVGFEGAGMRLVAKSPQLVFQQQVRPAPVSEESVPVLVGQKLIRADEPTRTDERGEEVERYVEGELLAQVVYTQRVVVSNPTGASHRLDVLVQIPRGAMPVAGSQRTDTTRLHLSPYETESLEAHFYFPHPGDFQHFPAHVARHEEVVAWAEARELEVVAEPSERDTTSWSYVSQQGSLEEVLARLGEANLERLDLSRIAWRMKERPAYERVLELLESRFVYERVLWSYALKHRDQRRLVQFLQGEPSFLRRCGLALSASWLEVCPLEQGWYQHLEYAPLVNARAHRLGEERKLLNDRFRQQWQAFVDLCRYRAELGADERLSLVYYLVLQDRLREAIEQLARVPREAVSCQLQHDYLSAWLALVAGEPERARQLVEPWIDHPVPRWRTRFRAVDAMLSELAGGEFTLVDAGLRDQRQAAHAQRDAALELEPAGARLRLVTHRLKRVTLRYYRMDLELLFSLQPFAWQDSGRFAYTAPHAEVVVEVEDGERELDPPAELAGQNLVVEALAEGRREVCALYAHRLALRVSANYGQLEVRERGGGGPLPATYVKCYARLKDGSERFYRDGYTDLRGRFDYSSLSTDLLSQTARFALLVASPSHGALVREVDPPQR